MFGLGSLFAKLLGYLFVIINFISFSLMGYDKSQAVAKGQRISEFTFFLLSCAGGYLGIFIGSMLFRHKTVKYSFQLKMIAGLALFYVLVF